MFQHKNSDHYAPIFLSILFAVYALFLAFFVTPLGDIPDESGHYAYVDDASKGRPFPVLGKPMQDRGIIPNDLWKDWGDEDRGNRINYITQHPPLYYVVAAIPYSLAKKLTSDKSLHAKSARIISAISYGLTFFILFHILKAVGLPKEHALIMAMWPLLLPQFTHLASGITNDIFLVALCAAATFYLVRFLTSENIKYAYYCAIFLGLVGATKMTAWILIGAFFGLIFLEIKRKGYRSFIHDILIFLIAFSAVFWWIRRNIFWHGSPFYHFGQEGIKENIPMGFLKFITQVPFFEWLPINTYAVLGFSGYCLSAPNREALIAGCKGAQFIRADDISYSIFLLSIVIVALMMVFFVLKKCKDNFKNTKHDKDGKIKSIIDFSTSLTPQSAAFKQISFAAIALGSLIIFLLFYTQIHQREFYSQFTVFAFALMFSSVFLSLYLFIFSKNVNDRIVFYGLAVITLFLLMLASRSHAAMPIGGNPSGVQGRYLFPFYPILFASFGILFRGRNAYIILCTLTIALILAHLNTYTSSLIPFFNFVAL